ncbi:MAG: mannitol/fructose-specific phosphotransferase system IIA component (Ntr-type) [Pseudohongiellaceae bacterium]|jgi:mannitol/fructose-specific phosphotransferase system IIA component (Ntr-type)
MTSPAPMADCFSSEAVILDLVADTKEAALEAMVRQAVEAKVLPRTRRDQAIEALLAREERGTTAMGGSVAMPHAKIGGLQRVAGLVARSVKGVEFRAVDGEPVHVFVMLISPESKADEHLATLRWISSAARDPDFQSFIRQSETAEDVLDVLRERAPEPFSG